MAEDLFSFVAERLEESTSLDRLESRGTLRIALKDSGVDPKTVSPREFCVVLENIAPRELETRGVAQASTVCAALIEKIQREPADRWQAAHSVDAIFDRLAGT